MTHKPVKLLMAILIAAACGGITLFGAQSQTANPPEQTAPQTTPETMPEHPSHARSGHMRRHHISDQAFATKAAEGGMAEVKLGQLAQEKGTSQAVKDFGKRMEQDHSKANDELKSAASQANINLPSQPSAQEQQTYDKLSKLSGEEFDRAYARDMVRDHMHDVRAFRQEAKSGSNQEIKNFAQQTLPTLEEHLKLARQMYRDVHHNGNTGETTGAGSGQ